MKYSDYERWSKRVAEWAQRYLTTIADRSVRAPTDPGDVLAQLPKTAPEQGESMATILADFERIVPDAMTHWQHPRFFAYFPANAAPASMIAEQIVSVMAAQCMLWQTSPAATEMETRMVEWMRDALGLEPHFQGVVHDSASTATLTAVLTMRERAYEWRGISSGSAGEKPARIYASAETHSSVDKAVWIAGIGQDNLVKIPTNQEFAMRPDALRQAIAADRAAGMTPAGIVLCIGGTSIGASDRPDEIIEIARDEGLYTHVDAAWAGSAMVCPEFRSIWTGIDGADSIVFNPHKWLGAQFDCSIQFLADPTDQVRTLSLRPDYLETLDQDTIVNYNEWTTPLGRRFRALKLWFLLRAYGLEGLRTRIRHHVAWAGELAEKIRTHDDFRITTEPRLSLFTFQYAPPDTHANEASEALLKRINDDGRTYLTQTKRGDDFVIRFQAGQFDCTRDDVLSVYDILTELIKE